ncbi:MAG: phage major capsid protein [Phycisphaerales bacterium]|nr:phage major capsid protein [Phycisphaerales bacterium]
MQLELNEFERQLKALQKMPAGEFRNEMLAQLKNASVYELDGKRRVPVTVKVMASEAPDVPAVDQAEIEKYVLKKLDDIRKANPLPGNPLGAMPTMNNYTPTGQRTKVFSSDHLAKNFGQWVAGLRPKGMSEGTNSAGGALVPDEFLPELIDQVNKFGVARRYARVYQMNSDTLTIPRVTGRTRAYYVGEGSNGTESTPSFDNVMLVAKKLMVLSIGTNELLADARDGGGIALADWLTMDAGRSIAYEEDLAAFIGDGTSTYGGHRGVVTLLGSTWPDTGNSSAGIQIATGNAWSEITLSDITSMMGKLPAWARDQAKFYCSSAFADSVLLKILKSAGGVTSMELSTGALPNFLGSEVVRTEVLPTSASNSSIPLIFGNLPQTIAFGDRKQVNIEIATTGTVGSVNLFTSDSWAARTTSRYTVVTHNVGNGSSTAGGVVGLRMAAA